MGVRRPRAPEASRARVEGSGTGLATVQVPGAWEFSPLFTPKSRTAPSKASKVGKLVSNVEMESLGEPTEIFHPMKSPVLSTSTEKSPVESSDVSVWRPSVKEKDDGVKTLELLRRNGEATVKEPWMESEVV